MFPDRRGAKMEVAELGRLLGTDDSPALRRLAKQLGFPIAKGQHPGRPAK